MPGLPSYFYKACFAALILFSAAARADVLDDILERGTLRVGVALFAPWTMQAESGKLSGFEIDVASKLAHDMGVKPQFVVYKWEDIIAGLQKGEIDVIAGGMAITPARALKVNFSRPYADSGITLATNTSLTRNIESLDALNRKDIAIAVVADTVSAELAQKLFDAARIRTFTTSEEAEKAVLDGSVHAYVASMPQPDFLALRYPDKVDVPLAKPLLTYKAGLAIRKREQEWLNFLNAWVTAREADKWLAATHKYWFDSLQWSKAAGQ